jgi:hypothetical protein
LAAVNAQLAAQLPIPFAQVSKGRGLTHTKLFQRGTGGVLGNITRILNGAFESVS